MRKAKMQAVNLELLGIIYDQERAIDRVRYLADIAVHKGIGVPMDDERFQQRMFAVEILKALDGELNA